MRTLYFNCAVATVIFTCVFFVSVNAQTLSNESKKRFEPVGVADGQNGGILFYKTTYGKTVDVESWRLKSVDEVKKRIETESSKAKDRLEMSTYFNKAKNQVAGYYVLEFENEKDKTNYFKIAKFINEYIEIITAPTLDLALEFGKWQETKNQENIEK